MRASVRLFVPLFSLLVVFLAAPTFVQAQHWPGSANPGYPPRTAFPLARLGSPPEPVFQRVPIDTSRLIEEESCESWTAAAVSSPTVSVARLAVPGKARGEFKKACKALKQHKMEKAEHHARRAVKIYPRYAAAWVVLGQILEAEHRNDEAKQACQQAKKVDPTYPPPYICLAQFAERTNHWDDAYALSGYALSLDPATDPYAYLYTAAADLHLKRYAQAELFARSAEKLDGQNHIPQIHLLLAEIYRAKADHADEVKELQIFLKHSPHNAQWQTAQTTLAELQNDTGN